ncbi:GGDEF domain-containing protein [Dyella dinghuensis]|uniref:GGDEF domain-containing protein n=1 Tax=Dyella dinghuensis TaxID=1920169 RepID=UPI0013157438|nr:GGDEF domain-containing protein [Dyella dinghuensis]
MLYALLFIAHALAIANDAQGTMCVSYIIILLVQWLTLTTAVWRCRHSTFPNSFRWVLTAIALAFVSFSNMAALAQAINGNYNLVPGASLFFGGIYSVMIVLSCATTFRRRTLRITTYIDMLMGAFLGLLFFVQIFSVVSSEGSANTNDVVFIIRMFDVIGIYMTLIAGVRLLGSESSSRRHFFFVLFSFLLTSTLLAALRNRLLLAYDNRFLELLLLPSFFVFGLLGLRPPPNWMARYKPKQSIVHISEGISPLFRGLGLLAVSISIWRDHPTLGAIGVCITVIGYGVRNVITQSAQMANERSLISLQRELQNLVVTDALTGIPNRRAFDELLDREVSVAKREGEPVSLLMIDIDLFKEYNDLYGHVRGDECLRTVARLLAGALRRPSDFIGRYGGEEFVVLLPRTPIAGAYTVARRMNKVIVDADLSHDKGLDRRVTVSIGVTTLENFGISNEELMHRADSNLYHAKSEGRNQYA